VASALFLAYILYVRWTLSSEGTMQEEISALYVCRIFRARERMIWIVLQVAASLGLMVWGAHMFVGYVRDLSLIMGVATVVLSMIITPIATELPEKCNSVIWVGRRKDILALGNITGAMVFQSSFPVAFGIVFTDWDLRGAPMVSAILAFASASLVLLWVKMKNSLNPYVLMTGGLLYAVFIVYISIHS
jgi:cation:H+ antiporter